MTSNNTTDNPATKLENQPEWILSAKQLSTKEMKSFQKASDYPELTTTIAANDQ